MVCHLRLIASVDIYEASKYTWLNYWPILIKSQYLPANATESERSPGISFLATVPTGLPVPMEFTPWITDFDDFMRSMRKTFKNESESWIIDSWQKFSLSIMPHKICQLPSSSSLYPGTYKVISDLVEDYIENCDEITTPLGHILYNPNNDFVKDHKERNAIAPPSSSLFSSSVLS
jgi:hypothetical protein